MFLVYILVAFLALEASAQTCANNTTAGYKMHLIDGTPKTNLTNCTYSFNISSGNCTLNTAQTPLASTNYVCFSEVSPTCTNFNFTAFAGIANRNCGGNMTTEAFNVTAVTPSQEFAINTTFIDARASVEMFCINSLNAETPASNWTVRNCLYPKTTLTVKQTSFSSGLQLGLMLLLLMIGMLFI